MTKMARLHISLAVITALGLGFSGCGGGGSSGSAVVGSATDVTVERGKVYEATVTDSSTPVKTAVQKAGLNVYTFASAPTYPISVTGGWIDVNADGIKDIGDVVLDVTLKSYSNVLTPLTTYIADENATLREAKLATIKAELNTLGIGTATLVTDDDLLGLPSTVQNLDFVLLTNAIYKEMKENGGSLASSDDASIMSQFSAIKGLTISTDPIDIEVAVMADLNSSGYVVYVPESEIPDENMTTPDTNTTGIYIAESNETTRYIYELMGSPVLNGSKVYMRQYKGLASGEVAMKVASYDVNSFNSDVNLSDLPTNILYEQTNPNYTTANFNQRYYDIAEADGNLYFSTLPADISTLSQSSFIKYNLSAASEIYHVKDNPVKGEFLNITFDLARGWFIPFSSGSYMGIVEDAVVKVIDTTDGSSYKYGIYDYFGRGATSGSYTDGIPPVATDSGFFSALSGSLYNVSFLSDYTSYGDRNIAVDPQYIENDILADVKANFTTLKDYYYVEQTAPLVLDDGNIYVLSTLKYDDSEGYPQYDLFLITYGIDSTVKSVTYLDGSTTLGSWFDVSETYKYNNRFYFKYRHDLKHELCSYDLSTSSFVFRHEIGDHPRAEDMPATSYVITGDTIIMPENIKRADYDADNNTSSTFLYDLVFKVIDINDGAVLNTLHHKDLDALIYSDNDVRVRASLSDSNSVYFFALRQTDTVTKNMIIKLDTPSNSVQKTRNRFDNHLTAVIK